MKYILIAASAIVLIYIIKYGIMLIRAWSGSKFWRRCEERFHDLITQGHSSEQALLILSREAHPELSDEVHRVFAQQFITVAMLAPFIHSALDFVPWWKFPYGRRLTDKEALAIAQCTTVAENGSVNTDYHKLNQILGR